MENLTRQSYILSCETKVESPSVNAPEPDEPHTKSHAIANFLLRLDRFHGAPHAIYLSPAAPQTANIANSSVAGFASVSGQMRDHVSVQTHRLNLSLR